ncbi:transposase [Moesziomyces antarcticus]|uniref:Transposase n=2 Tax=Pseudozyma antarctica TaxID=84753 RepID=A0A081CBQ0_PSEA2|nr:transposase [Moesziomyces antarcticus]GAK64096.1 transposase [Moesziomyces antarcticus]SPO44686.1 related to transposase [Moesziomyces antarcticus]
MPRSKSKTLSLETRTKLLEAINKQNMSVAEASRRLMVPYTTARSFIQHYKETGHVEPKKMGGNREPVLTNEHLDWIQSKLDNKSDIRLADIHNDMKRAFTFDKLPSITSIHRAINTKLQYTLKLLRVEPADYNKPSRIQARKEWAQDYVDSGSSLFNAIYIDESGFNLHQHVSYGRAKRGDRAIRIVPSDKGQNISYIAAIGAEGVVADFAYQASTTGKLFAWFLKERVFPKLQHRRQIILDNATIHKTADVRQVFQESIHECVFLPPYSPFLNAAEWHFALIKPRLSKEEYKNTESLLNAIRASANTVTPGMVTSWIREVNRNLIRSINGEILGREHHYNMQEGDEDLAVQLLEDLENMHVQV